VALTQHTPMLTSSRVRKMLCRRSRAAALFRASRTPDHAGRNDSVMPGTTTIRQGSSAPVTRTMLLYAQWFRNGTGPKRKWGAPIRRKAPEFFFARALQVLAQKGQLVVLVSAFVMVSTVWSVSCLLFFYSRCPPRAQPLVKVGCTFPSVPWSRRH